MRPRYGGERAGAAPYAVAVIFRRRGTGADAPRSRKPRPDLPVDRVSLDALRPDPVSVLARAAYLQLGQFEALSRAASGAGEIGDKEALSAAAGRALEKHKVLAADLRRRNVDPTSAMAEFRPAIDAYFALVAGDDWHELLTSIYLTGGLLDDFFTRLTAGLDGGERVSTVLAGDSGTEVIVRLLSRDIGEHPSLASRLAVWGRRLVGDALLQARAALPASRKTEGEERRIEPILTDLMAEHTRRMDRLGLTA